MEDRQYNEWFDQIFHEMTRGMEDHTFKHFNHSMGINILDKGHYKYEMKRRRMVPYEEAHKLADKYDQEHKDDNLDGLSPKAEEILRSLRQGADRHGNIIIGTAGLRALREIGWIPSSKHEHAPQQTELTGGFK